MAGLFGSSSKSQSQPDYTTMQIQTSTAGIPITLLWGTNKLAANLFWMANFQIHKSKGGKGGKGGGGKGSGTTTYTAEVEMGLCEGPIQGIGRVFSNNSVTSLAALILGLLDGSDAAGPGLDGMQNKHLAYVYSPYFDLGSAATLPAINFEVIGDLSGSVPNTSSGYDRSHDANFADIIWDFVGNPRYGMDPDLLPYIDSTSWNAYKDYCQCQSLIASPMLDTQDQALTTIQRWATISNTWIYWTGTAIKFAPLAPYPITDGLISYFPNLAPVYDLSYDDFVFDSTSKDSDPITFERLDPRDGYNRVEIDCLDRNNYYDSNPQYWEDLGSIQDYGLLQSQVVSASEICDPNVGKIIATLVGQRLTTIRNTYSFKLGYSYILLEPGDLLTITDPNLGINKLPIRITEVSEDDKGNLDIKAEEFPWAVGPTLHSTPVLVGIPNQPSSTFDPGIDQYADPGNVNQPMIVEPPASVTGGPPEIWIGASGGSNWGGATVYLSIDGLNYANVGNITSSTAQGHLTAALPAGTADPDTTHTISVDMTISGMDLPTGITHTDADQGTTASLIDDEVLSWGTVTPTGSMSYNLTYLRRGIYSSANAAHVSGAVFSRIDPGVVLKFNLPSQWIGVPIHVKLTSFNTFGLNTQDISTVVDYVYTPAGVAYTINPPTAATLTASHVTQSDGTSWLAMNLSWTGSTGPSLGSYEVQISGDGGTTWTAADNTTGPTATYFQFSPATPSTNYQGRVRAVSTNGLAMSAWSTSSVVNSGSAPSYTNKFSPYYSLQARKPLASEILFSLPIGFNVQFPANFSGSRGDVDTTAAASTVNLSVRQNGSNVGTITYAASTSGRNVATFTTVGGLALNLIAGDELSVVAPTTPDTTFLGFSFSLEGLR